MVPFVQCTAIVTEILTMTCIAVERHQGLVHPFKMKRQYTNQRAFTMLGMFVTLCHCDKASELRNSNKYLSLLTGSVQWSLGYVVSGPLCGEAEKVMGSLYKTWVAYLMLDRRQGDRKQWSRDKNDFYSQILNDLSLPSRPTS